MLILSETTDTIQVSLASTVATNELQCFASWRDITATPSYVAGRSASLTTGDTAIELVSAQAIATQRVIDHISIYNSDTAAATVTVKFDSDGTSYILWSGSLQTGERVGYEDGQGWNKLNSSGNLITSPSSGSSLFNSQYVLNGMLYENINRNQCQEVNTSLLSSGRLSLEAIYLPASTVVSNISFWSATTAAGTPTNQFFGLYDQNRNLLRSSNNDTTTAWAANSLKTLALTSSYTTTYSGLHYLGIMVTATTVPTIKGFTAATGGQLANSTPALRGTSNTGLTTSLPSTANAPAAVTTSAWCAVG